MEIPFPDECLRGIPQERQVIEDGLVDNEVFFFHDNQVRADGTHVQSVNWHDDDGAVAFTMAQVRTDGTLQFRGGVAILPRAQLDHLSRLPYFQEGLAYDREPLENNAYHGNLTLAPHVATIRWKQIAATLATSVSRVIPR